MFYTIVSIIILIVCVLLVLFVLVQNSKGGGLVSSLGGASNVVGVRKSADILEKGTWTLAISLVALCLIAVGALPNKTQEGTQSIIQEQVLRTQSGVMPTALPDVPSLEELQEAAPAEGAADEATE